MEDQQADSGDLTSDRTVPEGKPEGKAARRHRLPRQKPAAAAEPDVDSTNDAAAADPEDVAREQDSDAAPAEDVPAEPSDVESTDAEPTDVESTAVEPAASVPAVVSPQRRSRFSWRRAKGEGTPDDTGVAADELPTTATEFENDGEPAPAWNGEPEPEPVLVPHRTAGRALKVAAVVAGALFIGSAAFAGAALQPYLADRAEVHTKFEVAQTAANAITTLWTYTPEDMDTLPDRAAKFLGGDFAAEYRRYIDSIVASNKQAQISNDTQVLGAAVEDLSPTEATALVYTNSVATTPVTKGIPSLRYLSYRLSLERRDNQWLITRMTPVTSLDLTPKL